MIFANRNFLKSIRRVIPIGIFALASLAGLLRAQVQARGGSAKEPQAAGQAAASPSPGFVLHAQTNLVLVDVRVTDRSGRPVTDLKQQDFLVFEDGVTQVINSFSLEDVERLSIASATGENTPPAVIDLAKPTPDVPPAKILQNRRLLVLFFDLTSMPVDDLMRSLKAADDFVRTHLTPADLVAVVTYASSLRIVRNFTNDRDGLEKAIRSIQVGEASSLSAAGAEGEAGTTNAVGQEVVTQDVSAAFTPDETEFNIFNTDEKLAAIESLARLLRDVPGRKSVIHFSSGVERTGIENQAQLRATVDAANQANVSLYTLDARGLAALPPGGDASSASPAGTAVYSGQAIVSQVTSLEGGRETLASLAAETGGRTFYDLNDFSPAFQEVQALNSTYYLLGYTPSNKRDDGRFRRIRVEVTRAGLKVEARPGYFAPKDFRHFNREDKDLQLQQALDLDMPFVDLPLAVEAAYFRRLDGKFDVVLAAKIPGFAISFLKKSGTSETEFDFVWRAEDSGGRPDAFLRDTLPVKLTSGAYEQVLSGNILYEGRIVLTAGSYRLKAVVRENLSGKLGTFEQPLVLPEAGNTGLALSSVVLSNQLQETRPGEAKNRGKTENPLAVAGKSILPSVTRVFRTDQKLYLYLESYGGKTQSGAAGSPATGNVTAPELVPSVALVLFRHGRKVADAGPFSGKMMDRSRDRASYFVEFPLGKFPSGRYWIQVNVLDPARDRVAFARLPMAVVKPPVSIAIRSSR